MWKHRRGHPNVSFGRKTLCRITPRPMQQYCCPLAADWIATSTDSRRPTPTPYIYNKGHCSHWSSEEKTNVSPVANLYLAQHPQQLQRMHRASVASQPATHEQLSPVPEAGAKVATTKQKYVLASIQSGQTRSTPTKVLEPAPCSA